MKPGYYATIEEVCKAVQDEVGEYASLEYIRGEFKVEVRFHRACAIHLPRALADMLGLSEPVKAFAMNTSWTGRTTWDTKRGLSPMYVYCSLVEHQRIGDTSAPLLRVLPVRGEYGSMTARSFENIHYLPARGGLFQDVEVDLRNSLGEAIPFEGGRVVVVLHLRKAGMGGP